MSADTPPCGLVQKVPEPTVHAIFRCGAHLADLKQVRSVTLKESGSLDELKEWALGRAGNNGIFQHKLECKLQFRRIRSVPIHLKTRHFSARTHTDRARSIQRISQFERLLNVSKGLA